MLSDCETSCEKDNLLNLHKLNQ